MITKQTRIKAKTNEYYSKNQNNTQHTKHRTRILISKNRMSFLFILLIIQNPNWNRNLQVSRRAITHSLTLSRSRDASLQNLPNDQLVNPERVKEVKCSQQSLLAMAASFVTTFPANGKVCTPSIPWNFETHSNIP